MVYNNLDISLSDRCITHGGRYHPLRMEDYLLIYRWNPAELPYAMYKTSELRHIYRSFGHPSVLTTMNLLRRATLDTLVLSTHRKLEQIEHECAPCKTTGYKPRHFRMTIGSQALRVNHRI